MYFKKSLANRHGKRSKSRLEFLLRVFVISIVILIFYIRFLFATEDYNIEPSFKSNENSFDSYSNRKILSVKTKPNAANCSKPAILQFPSDGFTRSERQHGWILLHLIGTFYGFWCLAIICDDYLIPCIQQICEGYKIDCNIIGATVMAAAVSSPELFINCIGTFVTKDDIGMGTIMGSVLFNILAVPACCGLFIKNCIKLNWRSLARDCLVYLMAILALMFILLDDRVMWYEALALVSLYFIYIIVVSFNKKLCAKLKKLVRIFGINFHSGRYQEVSELTPLMGKNTFYIGSSFSLAGEAAHYEIETNLHASHVMLYLENQEKQELISSPWCFGEKSLIEFIFRWPITFVLWLTIPNVRRFSPLKYFTLILAIIWIAGVSYLVAFGITIIGDTFSIPDAVMGLTLLAAGMSIPEAVASIIVTRQGQGSMAISNTLGANTFDILLSLGLPWLLKSIFLPEQSGQHFIKLNSKGLAYTSIILLSSLLSFFLIILWQKLTLSWKMGLACLVAYLMFIAFAALIELNLFFMVNPAVCAH